MFNTIGNLTTQAAQVACFQNVARHLEPGGCFLIEPVSRISGACRMGERFVIFDFGEHHWGIDEYETVSQGLMSHHFERGADGTIAKSSGPFRYVWPAELDLMAQLAGLRLRDRWAGGSLSRLRMTAPNTSRSGRSRAASPDTMRRP